MKYNTLIFL